MSVVLDTSVYVSAFRFKGQPLDIVLLGVERQIDIVLSPSIIDETMTVLRRNKFRATPDELHQAESILHVCGRMVEPLIEPDAVKADPKDNHIVACALAGGAEQIVTGDHHLLDLGAYQGIQMVKVADFLSRFRGR